MSKLESYTRANGTIGYKTVIEGESLAQQQFKEDCDVNIIMNKYLKTGQITHVRLGQAGVYADLTQLPDYQDSLQAIINADKAFMELPADLRLKFGNSPHNMINYLRDPKNHKEAVQLGLMVQTDVDPNKSVVDAINNLQSSINDSSKKD